MSLNVEATRAAVEGTYLRSVISRFGGMIQEGTAVQIPPQTWDRNLSASPTSFRSRSVGRPTHSIVGSGVPGYMGWVPHGKGQTVGERNANDRAANRARFVAMSQRYHATDYKSLDRSLMPKRMPVVGYSGHLRNTKESVSCYGTSHWRPVVPTSRAAASAAAFDGAKQKALDIYKPGSYQHPDALFQA
jgi:hypothetical protein